jgi:tRNA threonylcarbamoyladenosine biosynthesis protein TsaE
VSTVAGRPVWSAEYPVASAAETQALAKRIGAQLRAGDLLVLTGELGAGKTTFTQGLGEGLGVRPGIISPTFVLMREHPSLGQGPDLVHVDAYRLDSAAEIDDIDLENTMDSSVTVVEWGRDRVEHLSESRLEIDLHRAVGLDDGRPSASLDFDTEDADEPRTIVMRGYGPRWPEAPELGAAMEGAR